MLDEAILLSHVNYVVDDLYNNDTLMWPIERFPHTKYLPQYRLQLAWYMIKEPNIVLDSSNLILVALCHFGFDHPRKVIDIHELAM